MCGVHKLLSLSFSFFLYFFSYKIPCFSGMLLRYYLSDFEMVSVAPGISGINFAFTFQITEILCIMRTFYFKIFSTFFLIKLLSPGIATYIDMHVPCLLLQIIMSGLLLGYYYYYYYYYY
jgi:hypothetical protein